jgi:hypothetical protein
MAMINKKKTILLFTLLMILLATAGEVMIAYLFPAYTSRTHLVVPLYFWVFYTVSVYALPERLDSGLLAKNLVWLKSLKMVVSLFALLVMALLFRDNAKGVIVDFLVFYLLLIVPESAYIMYIRKNIDKR